MALPAFPKDEHGFFKPGPVVRYFRERMTYTDRDGKVKHWTQADLAKRLEISTIMVRKMEATGTGLNLIERRRTLATLLNIPLALLGLASVTEQDKLMTEDNNATPTFIHRSNRIDEEKIQLYGDSDTLRLIKEKHDNGSLTPATIEKIIGYIQSIESPHIDQKIVAQYHIIAANTYMKDVRDWTNAQRHLSIVASISSENGYNDIAAIRLQVAGLMHGMQKDHLLAMSERDASLALVDKYGNSPQLKAHILASTSITRAITAIDQKDALYAQRLIDNAEKYVGEFNDYPCLSPFTLVSYLENKADVLISLKRYHSALECLKETEYCNVTKMRNREYIKILKAECYIKQKKPEYDEALRLLTQILVDNPNIAYYRSYAARLHKIIAASSYGNAPDVVDLGTKLRVVK